MKALDSSSINSNLTKECGIKGDYNYYQLCNKIRIAIKKQLKNKLHIPHKHIFILSNTTHCLLTVMQGLIQDGSGIDIVDGCYAPYKNFRVNSDNKSYKLITHITPDNAVVCNISSRSSIVDAAQSIGTIGYHHEALSADIVFFPLHKHLAIEVGFGILCVNNNPKYQSVVDIASISESGTQSLYQLNKLAKKIYLGKDFINIAIFKIDYYVKKKLASLAINILSPTDHETPFIVVKSNMANLLNMSESPLTITVKKLIPDQDIYRISCFIRGNLLLKKIDCTHILLELLIKNTKEIQHV
jgi:hypothetical protein